MLQDHSDEIAERAGAELHIRTIAVRDLSKERSVFIEKDIWTDDPVSVVDHPEVDIVVEVMGGTDPAHQLMMKALGAGKHVVTANKEVVSRHAKELFDAADAAGVDFSFEAAVAGGIPIIKPLKESLAGDRVTRVMGIVNGTTNFILTRMTEDGVDFESALAEATRLGYAEADPSADLEGFDAAAKLAILSSIAFDASLSADDVYREGITGVNQRDIAFAKTLGYVVKLLAIGERSDGQVSARVHPAMIPEHHPLAGVRENFNAVFVEAEQAGELMFYGRGAGGAPTATSVVGDIVDMARNIVSGGRGVGHLSHKQLAKVRPMGETTTHYYLLLEVLDRAGVLATVAKSFADHDVSIQSVWQEGFGDEARLVLVTHKAKETNFQSLIADLKDLNVVEEVASAMRVQSDED
jgi:homoserine dehydrogenase